MSDHLSYAELEEQIDYIASSPKNNSPLDLLVRRPKENHREVLDSGMLSTEDGLVGDMWKIRPSNRTPDKSAHPEMQLNIMNSRVISLIARSDDRWKLAGDQLFFDLDLSKENLPPGTQLQIGNAIIEVTAQPHTGCKKFVARFGLDAMKFVNSEIGKRHQMRGINAKVVQSGQIKKRRHRQKNRSMKTDLKEIEGAFKAMLTSLAPSIKIRVDNGKNFEAAGTIPAMQGKQKVDGYYFASVMPKPKDVRLYFFPIYTHAEAFSDVSDELRKCLKGKSCFHVKKLSPELETEFEGMMKKGAELYKNDGLI